jgi:hypothetical protein
VQPIAGLLLDRTVQPITGLLLDRTVQPIAGLFFLSTSLELLSVKVALTMGREVQKFNSVAETSASASLKSFGYRMLGL